MASLMRIPNFVLASVVALQLSSPHEARALWPESGLPVAAGTGSQRFLAMVPDGQCGAYVLWSNGTGVAGGMQRITRDGEVAAGWPGSGVALSDRELILAAPDGSGGVLLLEAGRQWVDPWPGFAYGRRLFATHFLPDSRRDPAWPDTGVVVFSEQYSLQDDYGLRMILPCAVAADPSGGATFVVHTERIPYTKSTLFVHVDEMGGARLDELQLTQTGASEARVAPDGAGGFAVLVNPAVRPDHIELLRYSPVTGLANPTWFTPPFHDDAEISLVALRPTGHFLARWHPVSSESGTVVLLDAQLASIASWTTPDAGTGFVAELPDEQGGYFIRTFRPDGDRLQRIDAFAGPAAGLWPAEDLPYRAFGPFAADGLGGYFELLPRVPAVELHTLNARHVSASGRPAPSWPEAGRVLEEAHFNLPEWFLDDGNPTLVASAPGVVLVGWTSYRGADSDVYVQRLADEYPVPTQVARAIGEITSNGVRLEWTLDGPTGTLTVEASSAAGGWTPVGEPELVSRDTWMLELRDFERGESIVYRLLDDGSPLAGSEVRLLVPVAAGLSLRGFVPNPTDRSGLVEFTLPNDAPASLELLDVAGRVLARREVGSLGPGVHRLGLATGMTLPTGVVFARLSSHGEVRIARAALLR